MSTTIDSAADSDAPAETDPAPSGSSRGLPRMLLHGSRAHLVYRSIGWLSFLVFAALVPFVVATPVVFGIGESTFTIGMENLNHGIAYAVAVLGINFLIGFTGQISLGNSFFLGTGAYLTAILVADYNWSFFATPLVVVPVCFVVGFLVGIPALRIRGLYLALVTLALAAVFPSLVKLDSLADKTGASNGKVVRSELDSPIDFESFGSSLERIKGIGPWFSGVGERQEHAIWSYVLISLIAGVCFLLASNMRRSRFGRALVAIRDNETGAAVSGVNLSLYKTLAFGVSAALCGVGGVLFTMAVGTLSPDTFGINLAIFLIVGLVVGGVATSWGPVIGGLVIIFIPHLTGQVGSINGYELTGDRPYGTLFLGLLLIALTFLLPGGVVDGFRRLARQIRPRRPTSARRGRRLIGPKLTASSTSHTLSHNPDHGRSQP